MKSVLLIEDDHQLRTVMADHLRKHGWTTFEAEDGDSGLALARQHCPEVVVCDLLLPRTNGFQICSAIRKEPELKRISIIAISGRGYASNRQTALESGADEFLSKPFKASDLDSILKRVSNPHSRSKEGEPIPSQTRKPGWIRFWGVRGSVPVPGPSTALYGGNTACIEVRADGQIIVLDAGTGIRPLGQELVREFNEQPLEVTLLITHTHWDHIHGFPFFLPAYQPKNRIHVLGYEGAQGGFAAVFGAQMERPYFPIALNQLPAEVLIRELKELEFNVGSIQVRAAFMNHPGICMGYRLFTSSGSIAYLPDNEPFDRTSSGLATTNAPKSEALAYAQAEDRKMLEFIRGADVLIIDAQYDAEEYMLHLGWGHGCVDEVVRMAIRADVKHLVLFHHDPNHDDEKITSMTEHARNLAAASKSSLVIEAAKEGAKIRCAAESKPNNHTSVTRRKLAVPHTA